MHLGANELFWWAQVRLVPEILDYSNPKIDWKTGNLEKTLGKYVLYHPGNAFSIFSFCYYNAKPFGHPKNGRLFNFSWLSISSCCFLQGCAFDIVPHLSPSISGTFLQVPSGYIIYKQYLTYSIDRWFISFDYLRMFLPIKDAFFKHSKLY